MVVVCVSVFGSVSDSRVPWRFVFTRHYDFNCVSNILNATYSSIIHTTEKVIMFRLRCDAKGLFCSFHFFDLFRSIHSSMLHVHNGINEHDVLNYCSVK